MPPSATRLFYCRSVGYELANTMFWRWNPSGFSKIRKTVRHLEFGILEASSWRAFVCALALVLARIVVIGTSMTRSTTRNGRWESVAIGLFAVFSFAALAFACYLIWVKCAGSSHTVFGIFSNSHHEVQGVETARPHTWPANYSCSPGDEASHRWRTAVPGTSRPRPWRTNYSRHPGDEPSPPLT